MNKEQIKEIVEECGCDLIVTEVPARSRNRKSQGGQRSQFLSVKTQQTTNYLGNLKYLQAMRSDELRAAIVSAMENGGGRA